MISVLAPFFLYNPAWNSPEQERKPQPTAATSRKARHHHDTSIKKCSFQAYFTFSSEFNDSKTLYSLKDKRLRQADFQPFIDLWIYFHHPKQTIWKGINSREIPCSVLFWGNASGSIFSQPILFAFSAFTMLKNRDSPQPPRGFKKNVHFFKRNNSSLYVIQRRKRQTDWCLLYGWPWLCLSAYKCSWTRLSHGLLVDCVKDSSVLLVNVNTCTHTCAHPKWLIFKVN